MKNRKSSVKKGLSGWVGEWHPTPRKQFYLILLGEVECTVSDGERRIFGPGSIALLERARAPQMKRGYIYGSNMIQ